MSRNHCHSAAVCLLTGLLFCAAAPVSAEVTTTATVEAAAQQSTSSLPVAATPAPREGNATFSRRHAENLERIKQGPVDLLFLGDSITNGWSKVPEIWEKSFGRWNPANFGIGGDRTQNVLWRLENGELEGIDPEVVVLMIGTNNTHDDSPEDIVLGIQRIIDFVQYKLPHTEILLLAVFPREPSMREGQLYTMPKEKVGEINKLLPGLAQPGRVRYLDIGSNFLKDGSVPKETMPDGLHLSSDGYQIWADAVTPVLEEMMVR